MIGHSRDENIVTRFKVLFAKFGKLFGAIGKTVDEDDDVFGLVSVIVKFCDADIAC